MEKKGESTMILIMQYLDFNLPNFLLWTVMIFFYGLSSFDILPRINPWDSLDYNNITSPIGVDIV